MDTYELLCCERSSGRDVTLMLEALTPNEAMEAAMRQGLVVGRLRRVEPGGAPAAPSGAPPGAPTALAVQAAVLAALQSDAFHRRLRRTIGLGVLYSLWFLLILIVLVAAALAAVFVLIFPAARAAG